MEFNRRPMRGGRGGKRGRGRGRGRGRRNVNNTRLGFIGRVVPLKFNYQPPRLENIIRYHENFTDLITTLTYKDQVMNMVNVYDPNVTGIGRVGYGWEICSKLYQRYRVISLKWDVQIMSYTNPVHLVIVPNNGINTFTDINFPSELPFSRTGICVPGSQPFRDIRTRSIDTLTGVSFEQYMIGEDYEGNVSNPGTTPTNAVLLHIGKYNPNTTTVTVITSVQLEYKVVWYDPVNITPTTRMIKIKEQNIDDEDEPIEGTCQGEKTLLSETQNIEEEEEQLMKRLDALKLEKEQLLKKKI